MKTTKELFDLSGRVAIITGGTGYIGRAFGETLSEWGANVLVTDLDETACIKRAAELSVDNTSSVLGFASDLAQPESAKQIVSKAIETWGRIDILIHNAAYTGMSGLKGYTAPFPEQSIEAWRAAMTVNLTAAFSLAQAAEPYLQTSKKGCIVNVSSIYGALGPNMSLYEGTPMGNSSAYAASKGGILQLSRYLATVLAPTIRVNSISPGGIERGQNEIFRKRYEALTPLKRMGTELDLKGALLLLVSDAGAYITGQNIMIDGGWSAW